MLISYFKKENKKKDSTVKDIATIGGGSILAAKGVKHGLPRALGLRLETHTTQGKAAKNILVNGGYLDPSYGGSGGAGENLKNKMPGMADQAEDFIKNSKGYVHITGYNNQTDKAARTIAPLYKKFQRDAYGNMIPDARTLYVAGSDRYYNDNFIPDPDDLALKTSNKVKVAATRLGAINQAIKREGLGNILKSSPKSRIATGIGLLAIGGWGAKKAAEASNNILNRRKYTKKKKSYWDKLKSR